MIARSVNTTPVRNVYHIDAALKRGMNFSNSLPAGMLPCRISAETCDDGLSVEREPRKVRCSCHF